MIPFQSIEIIAMQSYASVCYAKASTEKDGYALSNAYQPVVKFSHQLDKSITSASLLESEIELVSAVDSEFFVPIVALYRDQDGQALHFKDKGLVNLGSVYTELSKRGEYLEQDFVIALFLQILSAAIQLQNANPQRRISYASILITAGMGNLFIDSSGQMKCTGTSEQFLLKKEFISPVWSTLTPPELIIPGKAATIQTDIFSAGALLFQLLTGHLLFTDRMDKGRERITSRMYRNLHPTPSDVRGSLAAFDPIISKCLQFLPEKRYANLEELAIAVENVMTSKDSDQCGLELRRLYKQSKTTSGNSSSEEDLALAYSSF